MADYKAYLKDLDENADYWKKKYGTKEYSRLKGYVNAKDSYTALNSTKLTPSMQYIDDLTKNKDYWKNKYGTKKYESLFDYSLKLYDEEYDKVADTYSQVAKGIKTSTLQKYGLDYQYTDSYEDIVRKIAGIAPASFDISQYTGKPPEGYQAKDWTDADANTFLEEWQANQQKIKDTQNLQEIIKSDYNKSFYPTTPVQTEQLPQGAVFNDEKMQFIDRAKTKRQEQGQQEYDQYLTETVKRLMQFGKVDKGDLDPYRKAYEEIYGKTPTAQDLKDYVDRIGGKKLSTISEKYLDKKGIELETPEITGKDKEFLDRSKQILNDINMQNAQKAQEKAGDSAVGEMLGGGLLSGYKSLETGLLSAGSVVPQVLDYFRSIFDKNVDTEYWKDWRNYNAEKTAIENEMRRITLQETEGYEDWMGTGQDIAAGITSTGLSLMLGQIAGGVMSSVKTPSNMLTNPAIKPHVIDKIMPNPTLKTMFINQYGDSLNKYEKEGYKDAASVALVESLIMTYIEGMGGFASEKGNVAQGLIKVPKNKLAAFAKNWSVNFLEELGEEAFQSLTQGMVESATLGTPLLETEEIKMWATPEGLVSVGLSVAILSGIFGLQGMGVKMDAATEAYLKGDMQRASQLTTEAIDSAVAKGLTTDSAVYWDNIKAEITQNMNAKLAADEQKSLESIETTPDGQISVPELPQIDVLAQDAPQQARTAAQGVQATEYTPDTVTAPQAAQQATATHKTAISLLETYQNTEYGDMIESFIREGKADYTRETATTDLSKAIDAVQKGTLTPDNYASPIQDNGEIAKYNKVDVVRLMALLDNAVQQRDTATQEELTASLWDVGLQLGRGVQAFSLLKKSSPQMHLSAIQKEIARFNAEGAKKYGSKWVNVVLTDAEMQNILSGTTYETRTEVYQEAVKRMNKDLPHTLWEKIDQLRKTSMLFNPRTQMRNIIGNTMNMAMNALRRKAEAGLQQFLPKNQRTESFTISKKYRDIVKGEWESARQAYSNYGRYGMESALGKGYIQAFKDSGVGKIINNVSKATGWMLDMGDVVFGKHHYETALASFMQARGLDKPTGEARARAMSAALEATFRAENKASEAITALIKKGGVAGKTVSILVPFAKTPMNIAKEGFDYSPLGLGKSLFIDTIRVKRGSISATQHIHNISKGLVGFAVSTLGFLLAKGLLLPGVKLTGAPPDDKDERAFLYAQGWRPFSLQIGDAYYPISWAQPISAPLLFGVSVADMTKGEDIEFGDITGVVEAFFDSIADMSPLSGVTNILRYADTVGDIAIGVGSSLASQFVPSMGRTIGRIVDPANYDLYSGDVMENLKNQAVKGIPGLDALLQGIGIDTDVAQKVDVWGNLENQPDSIAARAGINVLSPTDISFSTEDDINKEIMRLYESTEDRGVFPIVFKDRELKTQDVKEIFGDSIKLSAKELQSLKQGIGQSSRAIVENYINSEQYKIADDTARAKTINSLYNDVKSLYREVKARGLDIESVLYQVEVQANEFYSGQSAYLSPVPDAAMLMREFDYGVQSKAADDLYALYKETGDNAFLLRPNESFTFRSQTYKYFSDPRVSVFKGYTNKEGKQYKGLEAIMDMLWFERQSEEQQQKIIKDTVRDILSAVEKDTVGSAALWEPISVETTEYDRFTQAGWVDYGPDDKIIEKMMEYNVYPKKTESFDSQELLGGTYALTEKDKEMLARMTYKELYKNFSALDAETIKKLTDKAYRDFKEEIIRREK